MLFFHSLLVTPLGGQNLDGFYYTEGERPLQVKSGFSLVFIKKFTILVPAQIWIVKKQRSAKNGRTL